MTTYKEMVYMCLDVLKMVSDDSHFQREHIIFLLDKYRGLILKQRYSDIKKDIPESNYQTICIDLEHIDGFEGDTCGGLGYLRSTKEIPDLLSIGNTKVSTLDYFQGNINFINKERFKYAGSTQYLKNMIYSTLAPNKHLYIKSANPQAYYLNKVRLTGIFEDSAKASELACDEDKQCKLMDRKYPLEEALIPAVIELVIKDLSTAKYQAKDDRNNANDDLSDLAAYIRQQVALGRRSPLYNDLS